LTFCPDPVEKNLMTRETPLERFRRLATWDSPHAASALEDHRDLYGNPGCEADGCTELATYVENDPEHELCCERHAIVDLFRRIGEEPWPKRY
jgi:hypothetical protein